MAYGLTPIEWGYVVGDYVEAGYTIEYEGVIELRHSVGTILIANSIKYTNYKLNILQPMENTVCNIPVYFTPKLSQLPFVANFPIMTDAELQSLYNFMFVDLPIFDSFVFAEIQNDKSYNVRFADLKLNVTQLKPGYNDVSINLIRI
jgi:hypothetical protein